MANSHIKSKFHGAEGSVVSCPSTWSIISVNIEVVEKVWLF